MRLEPDSRTGSSSGCIGTSSAPSTATASGSSTATGALPLQWFPDFRMPERSASREVPVSTWSTCMSDLSIGFIGLGNVGSQLAGNLQRHGFDLTVRDLDGARLEAFLARGAKSAATPGELAAAVEVVITCLPSPAACAEVMEASDGVLAGLGPGKIWLEMSTTDAAEVRRLAARVEAVGATALDCPVSGGCHRAATGNISIFAGGRSEERRVGKEGGAR